MKRKAVKKIIMSILTATMVVGMLAGCGGKDTETATANTEVSTQKEVTSNEVAAEKSVTMIQNTANELSAVIGEIQTATNHSFEKMVLTYQNESVTITEKSISDHKTNKKLTVTKTEKKKEFFNAQGVPQVSLTFKEVTKSAQPLKIEITWKDKEGAETSKSATVNIHVVPESLKVVKPLTENQKISETVKKYDFDVFAKNVADKAKESVVSATVKKSDVQFGKPGHYEVVYEVILKTDNGNDVPVDVEIVEKEQADKSEDVITENVKPGESKEDVPVDVEIVDKDNDNGAITENVKPGDDPTVKPEKKQETGGNTSSDKNNDSSDKNNQSDNNNNSSSNKPNSGNSSSNKPNSGNSGSNGNDKPVDKPSHKHSYSASVTAQPTCTSNGTKTYTCSCGDSYTESIPAYGHAWTHHDATGHWEKKEITPGWDEPIYETHAICGGCGKDFGAGEAGAIAALDHTMMDFWDNCENYHTESVQTGTTHHDAVYDNVWVEDSKAYDSCSNCGATK